jgi:hypothetical protein
MSATEFLNNCTACGGNWSAMIMSGIRKCFPEYYNKMENKAYTFDELYEITRECGVNWSL